MENETVTLQQLVNYSRELYRAEIDADRLARQIEARDRYSERHQMREAREESSRYFHRRISIEHFIDSAFPVGGVSYLLEQLRDLRQESDNLYLEFQNNDND